MADPPVGLTARRQRALAEAVAVLRAGAANDAADPAAALAALDAAWPNSNGTPGSEAQGSGAQASGAQGSGDTGEPPGMALALQLVRTGLRYLRAMRDGDHAELRRVMAETSTLVAGSADTPLAPYGQVLGDAIAVMTAQESGDLLAIRAAMERTQRSTEQLPPGNAELRRAADEATQMLSMMAPDPGTAAGPTDAQLAALRAAADQAGATGSQRASRQFAAGAAGLFAAGATGVGFAQITDPVKLDTTIADLRQAADATPVDHPLRVFRLASLALGLCRRAEITGGRADLVTARALLTEASEAAGGPEHQQWILTCTALTYVHRRLGDSAGSRRAALAGLRGYAWNVLLQSDAAAGAVAAREAAADAMETARWCLVDYAPSDAVRALDAGRGLILYSAAEMRDAATRLERAGHADLAGKWRAATASGVAGPVVVGPGVAGPGPGPSEPDGLGSPGQIPIELRRAVMAALSAGDTGAAELLDPPHPDQVRAALATLAADALVYLVPGTAPMPGWAVIIPVDGPCAFLTLPNLTLDDELDLERYLAAAADRDATLVPPASETRATAPDATAPDAGAPDAGAPDAGAPDAGVPKAAAATARDTTARDAAARPAEERFLASLERICDWAWRAAIGPLLERYLAARPAPPPGRPPRVVLIPMGTLARVPWQAARGRDGRYAVAHAAFSLAASARTLCRSAALSPVALAPLGLVVGDPDPAGAAGDLTAARIEAYAVHQAFYRGGRYLGRRLDGSTSRSGAGTAAQVRAWLADPGPAGGAMLHLACHGVVRSDPALAGTTSYLLLAGGDRLTAEELTGLLGRAPERAIGLVVLAACRSAVSHHGYDEAYSLATAFLAGGARSVLSTQWSVPDRETSVLMYLFHHHLMVGGLPAWEALRQAQLWMLDPARRPPDGMPAPLRRQLAISSPARVAAWAGFVHLGQ